MNRYTGGYLHPINSCFRLFTLVSISPDHCAETDVFQKRIKVNTTVLVISLEDVLNDVNLLRLCWYTYSFLNEDVTHGFNS